MLNASIRDIPLPRRMARLPISDKGFPVPWFVAKVNGEWDFRAIDTAKVVAAYRKRLCWLCGEPLGQYLAFVSGPMCAINRISSEPPSHLDCAEYAVKACPFLSKPRMRRNEVELPPMRVVPGISLDHNPGASLIWITKSYHAVSDNSGGVLFEIGPHKEVRWFAEGHPANRDQVMAAINKGLPHLRNIAATHDGPDGVAELEKKISIAMRLLPVQ